MPERPGDARLSELQALADRSPCVQRLARLQALADARTGGAGTDGPRRSLPRGLAAKMGAAFETDFSSVRVIEGPEAAQVGARAFTRGEELHFGPGEYRPQSAAGQRMIGHELAHVVQQRQGRVRGNVEIGGVSVNTQAGLEREADGAGERAARGEAAGMGESSPSLGSGTAGSPGVVQRREDEEEPGFSPEGFKRAMRAAFRQAGVYELIQHRQEREPDPNESDWPAHASAEALVEGRSRLRSVGRVNLGPLDVSGNSLRRMNTMEGHQFAELVERLRRGILILRMMRTDSSVDDGDTGYAKNSMLEWSRFAYMVCEGLAPENRDVIESVIRSLYDNWRGAPDEGTAHREEMATQTFEALEDLYFRGLELGEQIDGEPSRKKARKARRHGVDVFAQQFEHEGKKISPTEFKERRESLIDEHDEIISMLKSGEYDEVDSRFLKSEMAKVKKKMKERDHMSTFAYRMNPAVRRKVSKGGGARLSVNMDIGNAEGNARKLLKVVSKDTTNIYKSKIMGPANIGKRVDDAVIYLRRPGIAGAKEVARQANFTGPKRGTAPPGMEPIAPGVAYAENVEDSSSSHGANRGEIILNVIISKLNAKRRGKDVSIGEILDNWLEYHGYDAARPSLIREEEEEDWDFDSD
nr:DUF4157 domain-containing protein [Pseudenhygromyxa sp. WMMC2535]